MASDVRRYLSVQVTAKGATKTAKAVDNVANSMSRANAEQDKLEKGTAGIGKNSTANFAKMSQGLGGLVHVYATVAANVFALSAAFNVLRETADVDIMIQSAKQLSVSTGISYAGVAQSMKEITLGALDMKEALKAASIGISSGLSGKQMEQIAEIATKAANALGRSVPEAINRMTQAVVKNEPELVDEYGIILRVDSAMKDYAGTLGKTKSELSSFDKQMAIHGQLVKQGTEKFGDVEEQVNSYNKLNAAFIELTHSVLSFVNSALAPLAGFLSENLSILGALSALFAKSIFTKAIPLFADLNKNLLSGQAKKIDRLKDSLEDLSIQSAEGIEYNLAGKKDKDLKKQMLKSIKKSDFGVTGKSLQNSITESIDKGVSGVKWKKALASTELDEMLGELTLKYEEANRAGAKSFNYDGAQIRTREAQKVVDSYRLIGESEQKRLITEGKTTTQMQDQLTKAKLITSEYKAQSAMVKAGAASAFQGGIAGGYKQSQQILKDMPDAGKLAKGVTKVAGGLGTVVGHAGRALSFLSGWGIALTIALSLLGPLANAFGLTNEKAQAANEELENTNKQIKELQETAEKIDGKELKNFTDIMEQASAAANNATEQLDLLITQTSQLAQTQDLNFFDKLLNWDFTSQEQRISTFVQNMEDSFEDLGIEVPVDLEVSTKELIKLQSSYIAIKEHITEARDKMRNMSEDSVAYIKQNDEIAKSKQTQLDLVTQIKDAQKEMFKEQKAAMRVLREEDQLLRKISDITKKEGEKRNKRLGIITSDPLRNTIAAINTIKKKIDESRKEEKEDLKRHNAVLEKIENEHAGKVKAIYDKLIADKAQSRGSFNSHIVVSKATRDKESKQFLQAAEDQVKAREDQQKRLSSLSVKNAKTKTTSIEEEYENELGLKVDTKEEKQYLNYLEQTQIAQTNRKVALSQFNKVLAETNKLTEQGDLSAISANFRNEMTKVRYDIQDVNTQLSLAKRNRNEFLKTDEKLSTPSSQANYNVLDAEVRSLEAEREALQFKLKKEYTETKRQALVGIEIAKRQGQIAKTNLSIAQDRLTIAKDKANNGSAEEVRARYSAEISVHDKKILDYQKEQKVLRQQEVIESGRSKEIRAQIREIDSKINIELYNRNKLLKNNVAEAAAFAREMQFASLEVEKDLIGINTAIKKAESIAAKPRSTDAEKLQSLQLVNKLQEIKYTNELESIDIRRQKIQNTLDSNTEDELINKQALRDLAQNQADLELASLERQQQRLEMAEAEFELIKKNTKAVDIFNDTDAFLGKLGKEFDRISKDFSESIMDPVTRMADSMLRVMDTATDTLVDAVFAGENVGKAIRDAVLQVTEDITKEITKDILKGWSRDLMKNMFGIETVQQQLLSEQARTTAAVLQCNGKTPTTPQQQQSTDGIGGWIKEKWNNFKDWIGIGADETSEATRVVGSLTAERITEADVSNISALTGIEQSSIQNTDSMVHAIYSLGAAQATGNASGFASVVSSIAGMALGGFSGGGLSGASMTGSSGTAFMSPSFSSAATSVITPSFRSLATGGITSGPEVALIGDNHNGREAVVPLPSGDKIPVEFDGATQAGDTNITVTVNVQGGDSPEAMRRSAAQVAQAAGQATSRAMRRNG